MEYLKTMKENYMRVNEKIKKACKFARTEGRNSESITFTEGEMLLLQALLSNKINSIEKEY